MARDNPQKKKIDGRLIGLTQAHERRYWTHKLGVDLATLRQAIKATKSHSSAAVRAWLKKHGDGGAAAAVDR